MPTEEQKSETTATEAQSGSVDGTRAPCSGDYLPSADYVNEQLAKAKLLLAHATETGVAVSETTRAQVLCALEASHRGWTKPTASGLIEAVGVLSEKLRPVSAESLTACAREGSARRQLRLFSRWIWIMGPPLLAFSIADFCVSKLCEAVQTDLHTAQQLAVKLNTELYVESNENPAKGEIVKKFAPNVTRAHVVQDLTQFAIAIRALDAHAKRLSWFVRTERPPTAKPFELDATLHDLAKETTDAISAYQETRHYAQTVQSDASIFYGAILNCVLPMLYAVLGALAFLIRRFEARQRSRTFTEHDGHTARFAVAAIGGFVVGLFNVDVAHGTTAPPAQIASISPLAIAFLVGYAVDVFYALLEKMIRTLGGQRRDSDLAADASASARITVPPALHAR